MTESISASDLVPSNATPDSVWLAYPSGARELWKRTRAVYCEFPYVCREAGWDTEARDDIGPSKTEAEWALSLEITNEQVEELWKRAQ